MRDSVGQNIYFSLLFPIFLYFSFGGLPQYKLEKLKLFIFFYRFRTFVGTFSYFVAIYRGKGEFHLVIQPFIRTFAPLFNVLIQSKQWKSSIL